MLTDQEIEAVFGFHPAPGSTSVMSDLRHRVASRATTLTAAADGLDRVSVAAWVGHGADAFHGTLGNLRRDVRTAGGAHTDYASALYAYITEQESAKAQAQTLAQEALQAHQSHQSVVNQVTQYSQAPSGETDAARAQREQQLKDAHGRADAAQGDFDATMRRARALQAHMDGVAQQARQRIDAAAARAPYEQPGWLEQAWDGVKGAAGAVWHFVSSPEFLHALSTALNIVSAVCAFIPGLQGVAIVAAVLAIVVDVLAKVAAGQPINLLSVGLDAALVFIPGGRMARLFRGIPGPLREAAIGAVVGGVAAGARDVIDGRGLSAKDMAEGAAFGAVVGVVGHGVSSQIQTRLTASSARAEADAMQGLSRSRRPTKAGALVTPTHDVFPATSGTPHNPPNLHPDVVNYLDHIQMDAQGPFHGNCVEPQAISDALSKGLTMQDLKGSTIQTAGVYRAGHPSHGSVTPPCDSCQPLLDIFGITSVP
jgi:hypothetical protein